MSTIVTDTITGKSTATTVTIGSTPVVSASANSMTIRGEGSNQTSIQQGLLKSWIRFNGSGTIAINDNFNCSSITDNGTGDYTMTMQTAMSNANYAQTCGAGDVDHGAKINIAFTDANTTTAMRVRLAAAVSGNGDSSIVTNHVAGDLA
jgi:hypothetical protein